jgi:hypothetical protein
MPQHQKPNARLHEKKRRNKRLEAWRKKQAALQTPEAAKAAPKSQS